MKTILLLTPLLATMAFASNKSINTERVEHHQFKSLTKMVIKDGAVRVRGIKYNHSTEVYVDGGRNFSVPIEVFKRAKGLSSSVFRASPGDTGGHGTAFYVGGNLILTNQHVLSPSRNNTTECKWFSLSLQSDQKNKTVKCKEVHFCSKRLDFCLIEMKDHRKGYNIRKYQALKLVKNSTYDSKDRTMVIGNPAGQGIHASTGFGTIVKSVYSPYMPTFKFFAPLFGGNSGGPIFNDKNEVIGIATRQSLDLESEKAYNVGIPMETILNILEHKLKDKPEVLKQINY